MTPRVWFKSISLENVRSFGAEQTINFTDKDGKAARWNVILGDNGTGKTTVLNSLLISEFGPEGHPKLHQALRAKTLVIKINQEKEIFTEGALYFSSKDESSFEWNIKKNEITCNFNFDVLSAKYVTDFLVFSYPATRYISELNLSKDPDAYDTFIDGKEELVNAEEWLIQADYLSLKDATFKDRFNVVHAILLKLFQNQVTDIFISIEGDKPKVFFKTLYGNVRLHQLSLGYKTLIGWTVDLAKGMLEEYPNSPNPLAEPAVCLVDEIDLHLHPKFQRTIIPFLTGTFPNTQFIVTAHSPLIVMAAEEGAENPNIILLKREGDQTVVINDPVDVRNWSVDQILNSDLFGHTLPRSESLTQLQAERDGLLSKSKLSKKDKLRLAELDESIGFVPFGQDQTEIQAETIIQQLAHVLRNQQQVK